jgi:hypothetical protein
MVLSLMYPKKTDTSLRFIVEISIYTLVFTHYSYMIKTATLPLTQKIRCCSIES